MPHTNQKPVFYVTRDIERALGVAQNNENYHIITNQSPLSLHCAEVMGDKILHIESRDELGELQILSTQELLGLPEVKDYIRMQSSGRKPSIVVFKSTRQIESRCRDNGWLLANPAAELAERFENKISQALLFEAWSRGDGFQARFPRFCVVIVGEASYDNLAREYGLPFVAQFNRAHTGGGTHIINNSHDWQSLHARFPLRDVKISQYILGEVFTVNVCVVPAESPNDAAIVVGSPSLQITGIPTLTALPNATVGNDWSYARQVNGLKSQVENASNSIGMNLFRMGWRGLFGIDFILSRDDGELYVIEINARQAASAVCESYLQHSVGQQFTMMDSHLGSLWYTNDPLRRSFSEASELRMTRFAGASARRANYGLVNDAISGAQVFVRSTNPSSVYVKTDLMVGEYSFEGSVLSYVRSAHTIADVVNGHYFIFPKMLCGSFQFNDEMIRIQSRQSMTDANGHILPEVLGTVALVQKHIS